MQQMPKPEAIGNSRRFHALRCRIADSTFVHVNSSSINTNAMMEVHVNHFQFTTYVVVVDCLD